MHTKNFKRSLIIKQDIYILTDFLLEGKRINPSLLTITLKEQVKKLYCSMFSLICGH
jgi:hypothetical protein